jgi:hypothetical protein
MLHGQPWRLSPPSACQAIYGSGAATRHSSLWSLTKTAVGDRSCDPERQLLVQLQEGYYLGVHPARPCFGSERRA